MTEKIKSRLVDIVSYLATMFVYSRAISMFVYCSDHSGWN